MLHVGQRAFQRVFHLHCMKTKRMKLRQVIFDKVFLQSGKFVKRERELE
jgi:hypothetical protein